MEKERSTLNRNSNRINNKIIMQTKNRIRVKVKIFNKKKVKITIIVTTRVRK